MNQEMGHDPHATFPNAFFVQGRNASGARVWYTGRAGAAFISFDGNEAFRYDTKQAAHSEAVSLNRRISAHGIHFTVKSPLVRESASTNLKGAAMNEQKSPGQEAYERDVSIEPNHHDGSPRPAWSELPAVARTSWERNPTDRQTVDGKSNVKFHVTFEVVTEESAREGDAAERGTVGEFDKLRDALDALKSDGGSHVDGVRSIETDSSPCERPRWVTWEWGQNFMTGEHRTTSLHIPENVTAASARRIALLAGVERGRLRFPQPAVSAEMDDDRDNDLGVSR